MENQTAEKAPLDDLKNLIIQMDRNAIASHLPIVMNEFEPPEILNNGVYPALNYVRDVYQQRKTGIPEVLMTLNIVGNIINEISNINPMAPRDKTIAIGVIEGDIHDMGKNIVRDVYRGYGFNVTDMGKNVTLDQLLKVAKEEAPSVIGLSSMMSTTIDKIALAIDTLKKESLEVKIMVGGAFINPELAQKLNADGYAESAATIIEETDKLFS